MREEINDFFAIHGNVWYLLNKFSVSFHDQYSKQCWWWKIVEKKNLPFPLNIEYGHCIFCHIFIVDAFIMMTIMFSWKKISCFWRMLDLNLFGWWMNENGKGLSKNVLYSFIVFIESFCGLYLYISIIIINFFLPFQLSTPLKLKLYSSLFTLCFQLFVQIVNGDVYFFIHLENYLKKKTPPIWQ